MTKYEEKTVFKIALNHLQDICNQYEDCCDCPLWLEYDSQVVITGKLQHIHCASYLLGILREERYKED